MQIEEVIPALLQERPLSISQLRMFMRCQKAYELQYLTDPRTPVLDMGASVWFGKGIQRIIQRAYAGVPLIEGHIQVWQQECGPVFAALRDWYLLDEERKGAGSPTSNARKDWDLDHPSYRYLAAEIEAFQREHLGEWRWSDRHPLTAYFRWSTTFALNTPMAQVVVPHALLVEGLPVYSPDGEMIRRFHAESEPGGEQSQLLHGVIGGAHIVGVPDQFGIDPDGTAWISDNKVTTAPLTPQEIGEDSQLAVYALLLQQNGWIDKGQPLRVGHCTISEKEQPRHVWSDTSQYEKFVLAQLHEQFAQMKVALVRGTFLRVRGLQPSAFSPCKFCGVRHACL